MTPRQRYVANKMREAAEAIERGDIDLSHPPSMAEIEAGIARRHMRTSHAVLLTALAALHVALGFMLALGPPGVSQEWRIALAYAGGVVFFFGIGGLRYVWKTWR